jgi:hypothetical protein
MPIHQHAFFLSARLASPPDQVFGNGENTSEFQNPEGFIGWKHRCTVAAPTASTLTEVRFSSSGLQHSFKLRQLQIRYNAK